MSVLVVAVTDERGAIAEPAREAGSETLVLEPGTQRQQAHEFYFGEAMVIASFNLKKPLRWSR